MVSLSITKNILRNIKIHPLCWIFAFLSILFGMFRPFLFVMGLIFIHECGHFLAASFFGWKTDKIYLYPFGGLSSFEEDINCPIREEWVVLILGPLFQCLGFLIWKQFLSPASILQLQTYHHALLLFNLLPIYPLDGGKFLYLFTSSLFAYKKSLALTFLFSYLVLILFLCYVLLFHWSFVLLLLFFLLLYKLWIEDRKKQIYFQKFLLERYFNSYPFRKRRQVDSIYQMRRGYRHLFYEDGRYYTEKEFLRKRYGPHGLKQR